MNKQRIKFKSTEFQPKNEYLLIKPNKLDKEERSDSGIVIALERSSLERPSFGEVIAVGSDIEDIKPNMFVVWPDTDGIDLEFDDGDFMILRYRSVIGIQQS